MAQDVKKLSIGWRLKSGLLVISAVALVACSTIVDDEDADNKYQIPTKAIQNNPTAANYNVRLGIAYLQQGNVERGKKKLQLAMMQAPDSPMVLDGMGYFWEMTGEPGRAEEYFQKAIAMQPQKGDAQNNYGAFLCRQGRYDMAIKHFLLAVQDPNYISPAQAYENAGLCAMQIPNLALAEENFVKALQKEPRLPNSLLELGQINFDKGDFKASQQYLNRFIASTDDNAQSLWLAIRLARKFGDDKTAAYDAVLLKKKFAESKEYQDYLTTENIS